jgi:RNA polymerase sigma-70 factor (ECF subfamily)
MSPAPIARDSQLLVNWGRRDRRARTALMPLIHDGFPCSAHNRLAGKRPGHTAESSTLAGEAYLGLVPQDVSGWRNRARFFELAAQLMRCVLVDDARNGQATTRSKGASQLTPNTEVTVSHRQKAALLALADALNEVVALDPKMKRSVARAFFGGRSVEEAWAVPEILPALAKHDRPMAGARPETGTKQLDGYT